MGWFTDDFMKCVIGGGGGGARWRKEKHVPLTFLVVIGEAAAQSPSDVRITPETPALTAEHTHGTVVCSTAKCTCIIVRHYCGLGHCRLWASSSPSSEPRACRL